MAQAVVAATESTPVVPHVDDAHQTNTGVSNNKLGFWVFLASESLFFGAFIATYFLYRGRDAQFRPRALRAAPLKDANHYLEHFRAQWDDRLDRLEAYVARLQQRP